MSFKKRKTKAKKYNEEGKVVFNNIRMEWTSMEGLNSDDDDGGGDGQKKKKPETRRGNINELKKKLKEIERENDKIADLEAKGKDDEAAKTRMNKLWRSALQRSEGMKVKDDATLIKKSIKKSYKMKEQHKKRWKERRDEVEGVMKKKQEKRRRNINKRKDVKKAKKIKKLKKKGKLLNV